MSTEAHIEEPLKEGFALRPTAPSDAWDGQFEAILRAHLPALSRTQPLHPDDSLRDLGLDSVGTMEILLALEDLYGLEIHEESISGDAFASAGRLWLAVRDWRARDR
jgi:acyl carrier protein